MGEALVEELVRAAAARDGDGVASLLSVDVRVRALLPGGPVERHGVDAAVDEVRGWFPAEGEVEVVACEVAAVGDRLRASYRFRSASGVMEQHAFVDIGDGVVEVLDVVCSGWRPEPEARAATVHRFDAGEMGCTDGLAQEFRRRIRAIPVGDVLEVVARDPSAKADLPPLARMMGHNVLSVDAPGDGRVVFTVERGK